MDKYRVVILEVNEKRAVETWYVVLRNTDNPNDFNEICRCKDEYDADVICILLNKHKNS